MLPADLPAKWRAMADMFRDHHEDGIASAYSRCADGLEEALHAQDEEPLDLQQAAAESGYSRDHLGRLVGDGVIPNAGEAYSPRVRRRDLPRKPGHTVEGRTSQLDEPVPSRVQMARSVVESDRRTR